MSFPKMPVVNTTNQIRASKIVRWWKCRTKKICSTTPVICAIIVLTVSSVKLLNNVVAGTGTTMTETKQERRICDDCGMPAMHEVKYQDGKSYWKKCLNCLTIYTRPITKEETAAKNKKTLDSFFGFN